MSCLRELAGTPQAGETGCLRGPLATVSYGPREPSKAALEAGHPPCTVCHHLIDAEDQSLSLYMWSWPMCQSGYSDTSPTDSLWPAAWPSIPPGPLPDQKAVDEDSREKDAQR